MTKRTFITLAAMNFACALVIIGTSEGVNMAPVGFALLVFCCFIAVLLVYTAFHKEGVVETTPQMAEPK